MNYVHRSVQLTTQQPFGKRLPPEAMGRILWLIPEVVRRAVRMGIQGRSHSQGRRPEWLRAASDIRVVDYSAEDTTVHFEAPRLGDAACEVYEQGEFWPTKPPKEWTGFELLARVLSEVDARKLDSDAFDTPLLRSVARFDSVLETIFERVTLGDLEFNLPNPPALTRTLIAAARKLDSGTPAARRIRLVGTLDMIWASRQAFVLQIEGEPSEVRGVFVEGDIASLKAQLKRTVLVEGMAVYRPSHRVLRVDADRILAFDGAPGVWGSIPAPLDRKLASSSMWERQTARKNIGRVIGKWPGDETDEQILAALERTG